MIKRVSHLVKSDSYYHPADGTPQHVYGINVVYLTSHLIDYGCGYAELDGNSSVIMMPDNQSYNTQTKKVADIMETKKVFINQSVLEIMESNGYIKAELTLEQKDTLRNNGYGYNHVYKDSWGKIWVFLEWESAPNDHSMAYHLRYIEVANVTELLKSKPKPSYCWVDSFNIDEKLLVEHTEKVKDEIYYRNTLPDLHYSVVRVKDNAPPYNMLWFLYYMIVCDKIVHGSNDISEFTKIFDMPYNYNSTWQRIGEAVGELKR
jgi:hypothetical protein